MLRRMHLGYGVFAAGIALLTFSTIVWGPAALLWLTLARGGAGLPSASVSSTLFRLAISDADTVLTLYYVALALLVGANAALLAFYFKKYRAVPAGKVAGGLLGGLIALIGFGCAACGTLFFSTLLTALAGVGIGAVPFEGSLAWALRGVGLVVLLFSAWRLAKAARAPLVCPV